jgi:hypothetical protein
MRTAKATATVVFLLTALLGGWSKQDKLNLIYGAAILALSAKIDGKAPAEE